MRCATHILELLCSPLDWGRPDPYRRNDPPPGLRGGTWPPHLAVKGGVRWDGHLSRLFADRDVTERQWRLSFDFPANIVLTDPEAPAFTKFVQLHPDAETVLCAVRWDWSGAGLPPWPWEPDPQPIIPLSQPELLDLYTPILIDYGTEDWPITDRPQNIAALFGTWREWAYLPRTAPIPPAARLQFGAQIDWRYRTAPNGNQPAIPATRLDLVVSGLELYPRGA